MIVRRGTTARDDVDVAVVAVTETAAMAVAVAVVGGTGSAPLLVTEVAATEHLPPQGAKSLLGTSRTVCLGRI